MQNKIITLILLSLLTAMPVTVMADTTASAPEKPPAAMSDEALASYISGRLKQALASEDYTVNQYCDATGCSVVVQ